MSSEQDVSAKCIRPPTLPSDSRVGPNAPTTGSTLQEITRVLERGSGYLYSLQRHDGCFEGEVVWCPMILAQYVIVLNMLGRPIEPAEQDRMILHFRSTRRRDGGWGLHPESHSYVFVTTLAYIALRLLGMPADAPLTVEARKWLHAQPSGVLGIPSWGKFWLSMLGLYEYSGMNPCPPELFLLPDWSPVHPNHLYCHTRYIYLAISYLYGARFKGDLGPIIGELRGELYIAPYQTIDFAAHRHDVSPGDLFVAPSSMLRMAWNAMVAFERLRDRLPRLRTRRQRALARCLQRIRYEQQATNFQSLSPVNGLLNAVALWSDNPHDPMAAASLDNIAVWSWNDADDGFRVAGARSNSWDTSFAMLALLAGPGGAVNPSVLQRAYVFLDRAQEQGELFDRDREARDAIHGGWCFSDGRHRWPVSDCAAEALSALLAAHALGLVADAERVSAERLEAAVVFILDRQNPDGGFSSYERRRGLHLLERLNPSEMFGDCMTELSYIECTASALTAMCAFRDQYPDRLRDRVGRAIARGRTFLRERQLRDGSFPGFWGINFTYATWFAVTALRRAGVPAADPALARAAGWLVNRQKPDGGWGEHHSSHLKGHYVEHPESQVVMTSWALLALLEIVGADAEPVRRGIAWLCRAQMPDGSWPSGSVNGVFFGSAMLNYRLYPAYFPIWAINRYLALAAPC